MAVSFGIYWRIWSGIESDYDGIYVPYIAAWRVKHHAIDTAFSLLQPAKPFTHPTKIYSALQNKI